MKAPDKGERNPYNHLLGLGRLPNLLKNCVFPIKNNKRSSLFLYIAEVKDGANRPFLYDNLTNDLLC